MRGKPELVVMRNICCMAGVLMLISAFTGCAAGSCLSYGHSCWGAHGKRSGSNIRPLDGYALSNDKRVISDRLLLSRLLSRQIPLLPTKLRARAFAADQQPVLLIPQSLEDDQDMLPDMVAVKRSVPEKLRGIEDSKDYSKAEQRIYESGPSFTEMSSDQNDFVNNNENQAINMRYYKLLKNIEDKTK